MSIEEMLKIYEKVTQENKEKNSRDDDPCASCGNECSTPCSRLIDYLNGEN